MTRVVVLVGAGHAHLHLVNRASSFVDKGVRIVLVDPGEFWYSGMATGMLSGQYAPAEDRIDVGALAQSRGVDFIRGNLTRLDLHRRRVRLNTGDDLGYTCLSLNVGSVVPSLEIPSDGTVRTVPAKPISGLADLRADLEARMGTYGVMPSVGIVGGGATGTELAANLLGLAERFGVSPNVTLATSSPRLVPDLPVRASAALERSLVRRGLRLKTREAAVGFEGGIFRTEKDAFHCEIALLATGLVANPVVERLDLSGSRHGLKVNRFLQSVDDDRVFAVGDCADFGPRRLPKLGVFGVRSAPILHDNLLARVLDRPLRAYRPQRIWLAILNLGDGRGFLRWGPVWWQGRPSQRLKDHLDRRFLERFGG